ncbi:putative very-long-chain (3R)-3-hydroxyacyl-dehydratase [Escovopsis weberi]|uniref:Very-long-chain (3R)-3-hydroxyacyl-CoA dehydratase n=1 Tax=Escovopsis weberi TaxID=150374 RepID=A0A0M8N094_ESCWE|nr:putative very-long-chain (3R)-3-hydroxyacyl-dehydratase [Escovopsis weberi]
MAAAASSSLRTAYLVLYNAASAAAWAVVLARTLGVLSLDGPRAVYADVNEWLTYTQSMAGMEVLHSLFGIVRAPLLTTLLQISSRLLLIWAILFPFPALALYPTYSSMLVAWSVTEVIRYSFFAVGCLPSGKQPAFLTWLRYNTFFVLYPVGILSECSLIWLAAAGPAGGLASWAPYALYAILAIYVPGTYILYTHMMAQRRKVLRGLKAQTAKAQ